MADEEEMRGRTRRFYARYGNELEQIRELLEIKLRQVCLAYTINHQLPKTAIVVRSRVKSQESFLLKLESEGWPDFYYPWEVIKDLIGARIVCWFMDDCYNIVDSVMQSTLLTPRGESGFSLRDYIKNPQDAGYRGIHFYMDIKYDSVQLVDGQVRLVPQDMLCEIQVRTKLQDAWADLTHDFLYKKGSEDGSDVYEALLADVARRLETEDRTLVKLRDFYKGLADTKMKEGKRQGFRPRG